jgi:[ribosomal protein S5]-alanine N-acetyltransferase
MSWRDRSILARTRTENHPMRDLTMSILNRSCGIRGRFMADRRPPVIVAPDRIETARLVLRRLESTDATAVYQYASDPDVTRFMDWPTHTAREQSVAFVDFATSAWASGREFTWAITLAGSGALAGVVGCRPSGHAVDFGYVLARDQWGKGYATEAAKSVLGWVTSLDDIVRVWATCDVDNAASAHVLEKLGLLREGILRNWSIRPNLPDRPARDSFVYAWVRDG